MMNGIDGPVETTPIIEEVEYQVHKALSLVLLKHGGGLLRLPKKYSADDIKSMVKVPDNLDPVDVLGKLAEDNHKELLDHLISKNLPCMLTEFGGFYLDRHKSSLENIATISSL